MIHFHENHGAHVQLSKDKTSVCRNKSFANAVLFSRRPLAVQETFIFEITEQEVGWSGHVRCGITAHNPSKTKVPPYLLPDLAQMGQTWVFAVKPNPSKPLGDEQIRDDGSHNYQLLIGEKENSPIFCGEKAMENATLLPTDVGSRIGMKVTHSGDLYFYVNGRKFGPCASDLPVDSNLYAAVDIYGTTKAIKIIQSGGKNLLLHY